VKFQDKKGTIEEAKSDTALPTVLRVAFDFRCHNITLEQPVIGTNEANLAAESSQEIKLPTVVHYSIWQSTVDHTNIDITFISPEWVNNVTDSSEND